MTASALENYTTVTDVTPALHRITAGFRHEEAPDNCKTQSMHSIQSLVKELSTRATVSSRDP